MRLLVTAFLFLLLLGVSVYFLINNSSPSVQLTLWNGVKTPEVPVGLLVFISFFLGVGVGLLLFPLTYVIKRLSS